MMQPLHHQQQQLAALLSVALAKDDSSPVVTPSPSTAGSSAAAAAAVTSTAPASTIPVSSNADESARLSAINSLHRAILYPPNSLLVAHSASFLSQGFSQLLSDKSQPVRRSAAVSYGALCAVLCSIPIGTNGRPNPLVLGGLVDRFIAWALPLLANVTAGDAAMELAVDSLHEFLSVGDVVGTERFALPILKACQELLEDERTSFSLLRRLLGILTLISLKFYRFFQPHFVDVVDLLLGWVLVPDLAEADRRVILDSFLEFQKHWVTNLQFSLGLLSKFLGDMEVLLQDDTHGTPPQFRRLLALLSCFSTVLKSTASGLLEMNLLEQISEPLSKLLPRLLQGLSMIGRKFGWSKWIEDLWKCLTLLAEILGERFSTLYPLVVDILFQSLDQSRTNQLGGAEKVTSFQVHGVLKTNLQLLSLQKLGILPASVKKILEFNSPVSQLRLHPNHLVTGSSAATYIFLLQHGNDEVVQEAVTVLTEELDFLKGILKKTKNTRNEVTSVSNVKSFSKFELFSLMKFDLKVLLTCVSVIGDKNLIGHPEIAALYLKRVEKLSSFVIEKLNPFDLAVQDCVELQANIISMLERLASVEFWSRCSTKSITSGIASLEVAAKATCNVRSSQDGYSAFVADLMGKYNLVLIKALHYESPLALKMTALAWIERFCEILVVSFESAELEVSFGEAFCCNNPVGNIISAVFDAASDRESKVRLAVASVLELLLQARLMDAIYFYPMVEVVLDKLGDSDGDVKFAFVRLLSNVLPISVYACGIFDFGLSIMRKPVAGNSYNLHWKQVFALKQLKKQLHSQQLVTVLSYISQRWKVPLSCWIQRLSHASRNTKDNILGQLEDPHNSGGDFLLLDRKMDEDVLERMCLVNNLAGAWWAIHEAARYCIATRLRTNLGGPSQTFAALERMLLDVAHVLQLDIEQNDGNLSIIGSSGAHLLPMRLLLEFVESLKKNVYNAYAGSAILLPATRQSSLFFRANKKVCEEWFSRISEPMMNAGLALQCHDATIQYCTTRLLEIRSLFTSTLKDKSRAQAAENLRTTKDRFAGDILKVLRHMTVALCKIHDSESLIGLQQWASMTFSSVFVDDNQSVGYSGLSGPFTWITGLIYQSQCQYEKAAAYFCHLLQNEDSLSSMGSDGVQFAIARIIESYTAVSDWNSLESWLSELQTLRSKHAGKSYSGALTTTGNEVNAIHALARFDEGDFQAAWSCLDLTPKSSCELTLDPKLALQRSEQMLLQAMLLSVGGKEDKVAHEIQKAESMLDEILSVLPLDGIADAAAYATQLHCIFAFQEGQKLNSNQPKPKEHQSLLISYVGSVESRMSTVRQDCSSWLKVLRVYQNILPASPFTLKLSMSLLRLARRQGNFMLANRLNNQLRDNVTKCPDKRYHDTLLLHLQYEEFVREHAESKIEDAFSHLWSFLHPDVFSHGSVCSSSDESIVKAKACLKLAKWLRLDYPDISPRNIVLKMIADFNVDDGSLFSKSEAIADNLGSEASAVSLIEEFVGTATNLSTELCPTMGKTWISYASWCFNQARDSLLNPRETVLRSCSFSPALRSEVLPGRFKLTENEMASVKFLIFSLFGKEGVALVDEGKEENSCVDSVQHSGGSSAFNALLQQVVNMIETTAGFPGGENSSGETLSVTLASQLQTFLLGTETSLEMSNVATVVEDLVNIWWSLRRRRVSFFGHAAQGFMRYLTCSSAKTSDGHFAGSKCELLKQKSSSYTLRASLYTLHILLDYGVELKDIIEPGLPMVPLFPWQELTPQLFARLSSHPEQVVRKQLEGLLMMLAKLSPWSIVYPTLVDVNASEEKPSEELQHILGSLTELYPRLIQDVQLMINELGNVTVLWEELWLSTLQDLHADVMRRINVLKEEAARIAENATLSLTEKKKINAAKYSAMMAPIIVALERRLASTSRKPETPHETWFCEEYREKLRLAITKFKTPPASAASLGDAWRPFEDTASSLVSYQRKSCISLGEVAPQLALLSASSDVPMPGLEKQVSISESDRDLFTTQGIVRIASFCEEVTVLPTKTRPKKLVMLGSDGQKYTYLLKGREDLRLDARIMQLLQAINGFLRSSSDTHKDLLSVRYYSVTPVSGRAGLIQWVDNVISIYSVFKSWQNRAQQAQLSAVNAAGNARGSVPPPIPRPSDMFYGKIIPALKEKGIRRVISRRDWPLDVKRKVLLDLMKEVPKQLLHQELWCASEGFKAFSSKLRRYSGSVAAMSIVGHILGLGDRHLDNILVDFCSGDIVHIDYNVCFDKGQRLKIPEIVPFRLTQIIEAALGLTGVEGTFRASCEAVLSALKKNKDIILMLLEVFIWDPLVEWTRGDFHDDAAIGGEERKGMELAVSLSLFASRVQEIRVPLQEHHDLFLATLPIVESALEGFADVLNRYERASALFYQADQERSNLILHETSAKSIVADANSKLEKAQVSFEVHAREFAKAKTVIAETAQEAAAWVEQHSKILDALRSNLLPETNTSLKLGNAVADNLSLTSAVLVAGIPLTIVPEPTQVQCQDIDREVFQLIAELDYGVSSVRNGIQAYTCALRRILPLNYLTTSKVHGWTQLLQLAANPHSYDAVSLARRQAAELITRLNGENLDSAKHRHIELCCKVEKCAEEVKRVEGESAELANSIGFETETKARERLMSTFIKYIQSAGLVRKSDASPANQSGQLQITVDLEDKKEKVGMILNMAISSVYSEVKNNVLGICNISANSNDRFGTIFSGFEEQVERCVLVAGFVSELWQFLGAEFPGSDTGAEHQRSLNRRSVISNFQRTLTCCKCLVEQMTEVVLHEVMKSAVSLNSEVMDAFGLTSQIRGSIDTALEQLLNVEIERASLNELEKSYFVKVGFITEQQLALEEAAMKGRDHLSWEEAEELASQEEACRDQLDQLHQMWNQRESRTSSLLKNEIDTRNALVSTEWQFKSLTIGEDARNPQVLGSKALLSMLASPFCDLESVDQGLSTFTESVASSYTDDLTDLADLISSGYSVSGHIWKFGGLSSSQCFFVWKACIMDSILDSCIHDVASLMDQNLGFDHLFNVVKRKLQVQLEDHVGRYLRERVARTFVLWLDKEIQHLNQLTEEGSKELSPEQVRKDKGAVRKVQLMIEEYCNAHETARAARSAVLLMKKQANDLKEALHKASLEIVQLEWMYDALTPSQKNRTTFQTFLDRGDDLYSIIPSLTRPKLLEGMQSALTNISRSIDSLQSCERNSIAAEGQLERAMGWACGGPNSNSVGGHASSKTSGIPHEFHDHLARRRQLLWEAKDKATAIVKVSMSILEFEASRDGMFRIPGEGHLSTAGNDGRAWQQTYFNALTQLEMTYHSFTHAEQEWKLSQGTMEAASNGLFLATNELRNASLKAKSASGDLQSTVIAMRDCAYEASIALSSFSRVSRGHTALTSESGTMLEEVLAITEDLHDVHTLGKEASAVHHSLVEELSKANTILLPLESMLSKDVAAMTDAIAREKETKMDVSPIHGQALYQSYYSRIREAIQAIKPIVPSLTTSVKGLHSMLTSLARTAGLHAGNLHKALEGLAESQEVTSPEINSSRPEVDSDADQFDEKGTEQLSNPETETADDFHGEVECSMQDNGWVSPPDSVCSCSSVSDDVISIDTSMPDSSDSLVDFAHDSDGRMATSHLSSASSSQTDYRPAPDSSESFSKHEAAGQGEDQKSTILSGTEAIASPQETSQPLSQVSMAKLEGKDEDGSSSSRNKVEDDNHETAHTNSPTGTRVARGKNPYAVSVLRRVEMKIDGRDVAENREINIREQVDFLIKQAMSVDNLCNMYEGWTPWI